MAFVSAATGALAAAPVSLSVSVVGLMDHQSRGLQRREPARDWLLGQGDGQREERAPRVSGDSAAPKHMLMPSLHWRPTERHCGTSEKGGSINPRDGGSERLVPIRLPVPSPPTFLQPSEMGGGSPDLHLASGVC